ncbi:hypothetical protein [uncultured Campylobacter sp.]|jgi:hypothetical protein|uniref:hypothetical protein n=1 Tax=uncultured Campylobacter sp. TaxID=218934 RepID=UPI0015ACC88D|nr:hypothetical protein [uncultured Campylobacter sp.]
MNLLKLFLWTLWAMTAGYFLFMYVFRDWLIKSDIVNSGDHLFFYIVCTIIALIPAFILKYKLQRYREEKKIEEETRKFREELERERQLELEKEERERELQRQKEQRERELQRKEEELRKTQRRRKKRELQQEIEHLTDLLCNDVDNKAEVERKLQSAINSLELLKKADKNRRSWWDF